jgi:5-methylcytosine-specific restriction protein B
LLTREQVLQALRQLAREGRKLPPSTVYELVYRGRRYPPRVVAELAYRLATGNPTARWPRPAGTATNALLESLDFTISTKRPVLTSGSAHDGDETARQQAEDLYTGLAREATEAPAGTIAAEPLATYEASAYTRADALAELFITEAELDAALAGLARRRNLLLQGPPARAKRFWRAGWRGCWAPATRATSSWCSFIPVTGTKILCWASGPTPAAAFTWCPGCCRCCASGPRPTPAGRTFC